MYDIFWSAHATDGVAVDVVLPLRRLGLEVRRHGRLDTAWTESIDPHLVAGVGHGHGSRQGNHPALAGRVSMPSKRAADEASNRGRVDDRAPTRLDQGRDTVLRA